MGSFISSNSTGSGDNIEYLNGTDLVLHPHWKLYEEELLSVPAYIHYILGIYIAIVGIMGTLGNALVIYIFATTKSLRTPPNLFIINLAISDMGFSAIIGFPLMTISCFLKKWTFGMLACEIYGALGGLFGFNSIGTLAWISVDRYYVIAYPFDAMRKCTHSRALIQILFVWLWSAALSIPALFGWGRYIPDGLHAYCSMDYLTQSWSVITHVWAMVIAGLLLPVATCFICYINIFRVVTAQNKSMSKTAEKMKAKQDDAEKKRKQEIELAKVAAINVSLFIISWTSYAIISVLGILGFVEYVTPYTSQIPVMVAKASAIWNPLLYSLNHPRYRAALKERFPWMVPFKDKEEKEQKKEERKKPKNLDPDSSDCTEGETVVEQPHVSTVPTGPSYAQLRAQMQQQEQQQQQQQRLQHQAYTNPAFQPDQQPSGVIIGPQGFPYAVPPVAYYPYPAGAAPCPGHAPCAPCPHGSPHVTKGGDDKQRRRRRSDSGSEDGYDFTDSGKNKDRRKSEVATESAKPVEDGGEV